MKMHIARRLSEAIGSWLHLEFCCYRAGLFSENSLKAAVGSVLSSFPIKSKGVRVYADYPHAALNPIAKAGRRREVDFALVLSGRGVPKSGAEVLVETKWADSSHCSPQKLFADFLRLTILKAADPDAVCVFILAGNDKSVGEVLEQMPFITAEKPNRGIGSSGHQKRLTLDSSNLSHRGCFKKTIKDFAKSGFLIPDSFVTRSHGRHPAQTKDGAVDFQAIAWEVVSVSAQHLDPTKW